MALRPEPMQRMLIVASKGYQEKVIETLHGLRAAHFIDFQESREGDLAEFTIGQPLPAGAPASERLVRVRALLRQLGVEGAVADKTFAVRDLEARLDADLDHAEAEVSRAAQTREAVRQQLTEGRETEAKLAPLATIPLALEDYRGYDTLTRYAGRADPAFAAEVARASPEHLLVKGDGTLFALFVPAATAQAVSEVLYRHGYAEIEVPEGRGRPEERVREIAAERESLNARLTKAEADLARLAGEHKDFLLAAEEHLGILVEKAEAPLSFAASDNAVIIDAWVPMSSAAKVEMAIHTVSGGNVAVARLETSADVEHDHGHDHSHGGIDAANAAHPQLSAPKSVPPTKYDNPKATRRFEFFTNLFSTPRFNEIDPTSAFAIFFPLFFGFMIGDLGLGLLMIGLGWLLATKLPRIDGTKQLGTAVILAGVVAAALGGFVFKDAMGIPFAFNHHMDDILAEQGLAAACTPEVYKALHETNWGCILGGNVWHAEPLVYKVYDVPTMLLLSVLAALVHLLLGLLFGLRNELGHGAKHVGAKVGYLVLLLTFFPAVVALLRPDMMVGYVPTGDAHPAIAWHLPFSATQAYMGAGVGFLLGVVILGWAEGVGGVLEIPSMFSAIMSYLRLGAVAIAKGAMAVAFNNLTLVAALTGGSVVVLVLGLFGFVVAQIVLFVLGMLSGGIQALRLNFVEFFTKFYKGGGAPFSPFGRERQVTTAPATGARGMATTLILNKP